MRIGLTRVLAAIRVRRAAGAAPWRKRAAATGKKT